MVMPVVSFQFLFFCFLAEIITAKWQNIRDSFVKSLKKKTGEARKKKYIYHDNLTFLLKVVQSDDTQSSLDDSQYDEQSQITESQTEEEEEEAAADKTTQVQSCKITAKAKDTYNPPKRARLQEEVDRRILTALEKPPDEDEAFFVSITPTVRKMTDEEKLEFRMEVLQVIQRIQKRKNFQPRPFSASTSRCSTSLSQRSFLLSDNSGNTEEVSFFEDNQEQLPSYNSTQLPYNDVTPTTSSAYYQDL